tara:strand:- start:153 stop:380 length:228 start_codon:yes stop_codon:yes gene_type:complete
MTPAEEIKVYDDIFEHVMHLLNRHQFPVELVAGTMMAIAQRLYKTHLDDEDYKKMMKVITEQEIEPYNVDRVRIH